MSNPDTPRRGPSWTRWRLLGSAIGLLLLAAAVVLVIRHAKEVGTALHAISHPDPRTLAMLVFTVLVSIPVSAAAQIVMLRRFARRRVAMGEMCQLVCVSTVLNSLPLWPGVFGRIAYHRVVHDIAMLDAGKAIVSVRVLGLATGVLLLGLIWADGHLFQAGDLRIAWAGVAAGLLVPAIAPRLRLVATASLLKWIDLFISHLQYVLAFGLLGVEIDVTTGFALAGIGSVAASVPFLGGGPGLREWSVGWMTSIVARLPDALVLGVMADLVLRVVTLAIMIPLGVVFGNVLRRRLHGAVQAKIAKAQSAEGSIPRSSTVKSDLKA